jgi:hypothetical protein
LCENKRTKKIMLPIVSNDKELERIQIPPETRLMLNISVNILFEILSQDQRYLETSKGDFTYK